MMPARRSPSARTLGIQLVAMSTVLALMARMFLTASRPMPVIATSRNATTVMILVRMEYLASMGRISWSWARGEHAGWWHGEGWKTVDALPTSNQMRPQVELTRVGQIPTRAGLTGT